MRSGEEGRGDGADPPRCQRVVQAGLGGRGRLAGGRGRECAPGVEHELAVPPPDDGPAVGAGERAAEVAHLHEEDVAVGVLEQRHRAGRVERAEQGVAGLEHDRAGRLVVDAAQRTDRQHADGVLDRPGGSQRGEQRRGFGGRADVRDADVGDAPPADGLRDGREVGQAHEQHRRVHGLGQPGGPLHPAVHGGGDRVAGEPEPAADDGGQGQRLGDQRGHDAEAAAAAEQRPEEIGLGVGGDGARCAVRGDHVERAHPVGRVAERAAEQR